jgi:hypothetical protein
MEYSPTGSFLDDPTFDIEDRNFTVPNYTGSVSNGWLTITTSRMTLHCQVGSGPFTAVNTQMQLLGALPREPTPTSPRPGNGSAPSARPARPARRPSAAGPRSPTTTSTTKARPASLPGSTALVSFV